MHISRLRIQNFKSIRNLELLEPNPFTVFIGPNGAGKSNIFEALEFINYNATFGYKTAERLWGGEENFLNRGNRAARLDFEVEYDSGEEEAGIKVRFSTGAHSDINYHFGFDNQPIKSGQAQAMAVFHAFSRIFLRNKAQERVFFNDERRLSFSAGNIDKVLKRLLQNEATKAEMLDWLQLLIPEFKDIAVHSDHISGIDAFYIYEEHSDQPFPKSLISDGTYNIIALLTAVFQSEEPQFLCIESPEYGLNPKAIKELLNLFRTACAERGHYIWLNTHSQALVSELEPEEVVLVDKKEGATVVKQIKKKNLHGMRMDEAWLSNALGGGLPW